ncbi:hypothetical protein PLESTB_001159200 [Pleodorina starrii]|uniref:phytol kinase n=1 Tax=Pleodorina starrii TaxID=330485 RepID=A0A9W6F5W0_9CHLO|nr:hypothetical protein PLESTB_001159200 [Pleodorina starrii]
MGQLRRDTEDAIINFLPSKPYYQPIDDLPIDSWSWFLSAAVRTRVPLFVARELESLRRYLLTTAKFPQPAVQVDNATRCLLLAARVADLGLRTPEARSAIAESHMLEHACALRLTLAERPWNWDSSGADSCLFGVLKRAAQSLPWRWFQGVPTCTPTAVLLRSRSPRAEVAGGGAAAASLTAPEAAPRAAPPGEQQGCEQLWRVLSHSAVQCFLGWWLAASMVVLRPGGSGFSLPGNLMVACRACWQRRDGGGGGGGGGQRDDVELRGLQAPLQAAAASWMYGMLMRQCRGGATGAATDGATGAAAAEVEAGAAAAAVAPRPLSAAAGASPSKAAAAAAPVAALAATAPSAPADSEPAAAPAQAPAAAPTVAQSGSTELPYSAQNMYDMMLPVGEYCVDFVASVSTLGSLFSDSLATAALALALSLQHMPPDAAAARLPSCWQLLGRILAMDLGSTRSRALRDLAQAAGRALRLPPPPQSPPPPPSRGPSSRPPSATAGLTADRSQTSGGGGDCRSSHTALDVEYDATADAAAAVAAGPSTDFAAPGDDDKGGDGGGGGGGGAQRHSQPQQQHPQPSRQQQPRQRHHQHHHVHHVHHVHHQHHQQQQQQQPPASPSDDRYQQPSWTLRCALGSPFLPSLERYLRSLLRLPGSGAAAAAAGGGGGGTDRGGPASRQGAAYDLASACIAVDLALRRPGCWPALLAHAPLQQIAALILTMRKLTIAADGLALGLLPPPPPATAGARATAAAEATGATEAQPLGDPRVVWRMQLVALLEQSLPFTRAPAAAAAAVTAAAAAAAAGIVEPAAAAGGVGGGRGAPRLTSSMPRRSTSPPSSLGAVRMAPVPELPGPYLYVNRGLCGAGGAPSRGGSFAAATAAAAAAAAAVSEDNREIDAGPSWLEVLSFGPCPAVGSPARSQQERIVVLAAAAWLPLLLTARGGDVSDGTGGAASGGSGGISSDRPVPVPIAVLAVHGGHRVAWQWLLVVARQCLAAVGTAAHAGWMRLLRRTLVVDQITAVLRLYCTWEKWSQRVMTTETAVAISTSGGAAGIGGDSDAAAAAAAGVRFDRRYDTSGGDSVSSGGGAAAAAGLDPAGWELHGAAARVCEVMPVVLDVLEVLVAAVPEAVALALADNRKARSFVSVAEDLGDAADANADEGPYPDGRSPAALAAHHRRRQQRQQREEARQAALPPGWGPGLPLDSAVVSVLTQYGRYELLNCLSELSRARDDRFSFRPQGLAAAAPAPATRLTGLQDCGGGWRELPDPSDVVQQYLGFTVCSYDGCANLEGSSEATLLLRAGGGGGRGRSRPAVSYCCVACQQADRLATAAAAAAETRRSERRRASGRDREAV